MTGCGTGLINRLYRFLLDFLMQELSETDIFAR
jgi:hypothetical protein